MYGFRPESRSVEDPRRSESAVHLDRIDIVLLKLLDDPDDDLSPRAPRFAIGVGLGGLIQGERHYLKRQNSRLHGNDRNVFLDFLRLHHK